MAHRLAQPMTALRGGIELGLMGKRTVADYRALLEQSLQLADSMVQMIVSLRDLGESSAPSGTPQRMHLEATVTEVLAVTDTSYPWRVNGASPRSGQARAAAGARLAAASALNFDSRSSVQT